ncbi:MAG: hypothetical protein WAT92_00285 [Saprospiraceae bacterium]
MVIYIEESKVILFAEVEKEIGDLIDTNIAKGEKGDTGATGATGATGSTGSTGSTGLSAYQLALNSGFVGSEVQWRASLVGARGPSGYDGSDADASLWATFSANADVDIDGFDINNVNDLNISHVLKLAPMAYASLPESPSVGTIAHINDSDTNVWGSPIAGDSSKVVLAFFNGTYWTVMGK